MGIISLIKETISAINYPTNYSKSEAYDSIQKKLGLDTSEILIIGNNLFTDILPAIEKGFRVVLIGKNKSFHEKIDYIDTIYDLEKFLTIKGSLERE